MSLPYIEGGRGVKFTESTCTSRTWRSLFTEISIRYYERYIATQIFCLNLKYRVQRRKRIKTVKWMRKQVGKDKWRSLPLNFLFGQDSRFKKINSCYSCLFFSDLLHSLEDVRIKLDHFNYANRVRGDKFFPVGAMKT